MTGYNTTQNQKIMNRAIIGALALWLVFSGVAAAEQLYVNEDGWWRDGGAFNESGTPIQAAVDAAGEGDAIYVYNGTYYEGGGVSITKDRITLQGEDVNTTIIHGKWIVNKVVHVTGDYVNVSGLTVTGSASYGSGIYVNADNCTISDNNASEHEHGIYLYSSSNCVLENNNASSNYRGIYSQSSSNCTLENNNVNSNRYGIYLGSTSINNNIQGNTVSDNTNYGIYLDYSSDNEIHHNNFIDNNKQAYDHNGFNSWDKGASVGGNYWSDQSCSGNPSDGTEPYTGIDTNAGAVDTYPFEEPDGWVIEIPTYVSGIISSDTTWTAADSPYIVTGNILVEEGVTLTIGQSVIVRFDGNYYILVEGTLSAVGTTGNMITFTSNKSIPAPGDWGQIYFSDSSDDVNCILKYCIIEYGGGLSVGAGSTRAGIQARMSSPTLSNNVIAHNAGHGGIACIDDASPIISNNTITSNANAGIHCAGNIPRPSIANNTIILNKIGIYLFLHCYPIIKYNNIHNNSDYDIQLYNDVPDVDATYNYWGTISTTVIGQHIYDFYDDYTLGKVIYVPFLTEPVPCAPTPEEPPAFTTADAVIALQIAVGSREYDSRWDVSDDGKVSSLDALMILQMVT